MLLRRRLAGFHNFLIKCGFNPFHAGELQRRRKMASLELKLCENVDEEQICVNETMLFKFSPREIKSNRAIIFFHGGGFVIGNVPYYRHFLSQIASNQNCLVFSPNYLKAPEHPYPQSQTSALECVEFVFENSSKFSIDPEKIVFCGDSAGGFLAVNIWYRLVQKESKFMPCALSLLYPCLGYRPDTPSCNRNANRPPLTKEVISFFYLCHVGESHEKYKYQMLRENSHLDFTKIPQKLKDRADPKKWLSDSELKDWSGETAEVRRNFSEEEKAFRNRLTNLVQSPLFCPLFIDDETLKKMPHIDIFVCENDILKNDGQMLHARLKALGKSSRLEVFGGAFHANLVLSRFFGLVPKRLFPRTNLFAENFLNSLSKLGVRMKILNTSIIFNNLIIQNFL